jgi:hypothetical protein
MVFIIIGVVLLVCSGLILLVYSHLAVNNWEQKRVYSLTRNQYQHNHNQVNATFHDVDTAVGAQHIQPENKPLQTITQSSVKSLQSMYTNTIHNIPPRKTWVHWMKIVGKKLWFTIQFLLKNAKKFVLYLISLTKPTVIQPPQQQGDMFSERAKEAEKIEDQKSYAEFLDKVGTNKHSSQNVTSTSNTSHRSNHHATIGTTGSASRKIEEDMTMFEKLEHRLIEKLKQSNMSDYDTWLELGDLYLKYGENKEAMEIYALVMKHSKQEEVVQIAKNRLIGL